MRKLPALLAVLLGLAAPAAAFVPSARLDWDAPAAEVTARCRAAKERAEAALKAVAAVPPAERTFANTPEALELALWELYDSQGSGIFLKYVSVSSAVRDAANDCETLLNKFGVEVFTREDLYEAVRQYAAKGEALEGEAKRLVAKELLDFKRNGLALAPAKRAEVKRIKQRLVELEAQFGKNLNEVTDALLVTRSELDGLGEDYVARLAREGDKYKVTLDYPDYFPFMNNARDPEARRKLEFLFANRAQGENLPILKEVLSLRAQAAGLLGYKTHAGYVLEDRMAKDPAKVQAFLERLRRRLGPLGAEELKVMLRLKANEEGGRSDGVIHAWDWRYYDNLLKVRRHQLDAEKIKEYFPMEKVTEGLLGVYQELLSVKFRRVPDGKAWHPDVSLYEITDAAGGDPIGYFYMDLFPREGKYKHAAAFDFIKGRRLPDGRYQPPVSAVVANFSRPTPGRPSLLKHGEHEEVETFFHEFGHIMHQTLTRARFGRFSGSSTARDFVEAPSQMLENWVWDPTVLARLSGHYKDGSPLPEDLLKRMIAAKHVDAGLVNLRQLFLATIDLTYHAGDVADTTATFGKVMKEVSMIPMTEGTHPEASFGHLLGGYDAGYYGYMWSKVYAEDMFTRFEAQGLLDPAVGRRYRSVILERGGSAEEMDLLKEFLGREPNEDGFLRSLGLAERN